MANESREIALTHSEIVKAMVLYSNRSDSPIPADAEIHDFGTDTKGEAFVELQADGLSRTYEASVLLSAAIYFCGLCKIPLPRSAEKVLEWRGANLALVIRDWGFQTPGLGMLVAYMM